jgi:hypothetical protein
MEAAEWGKCRWDPAAKPGAQFLDLDYQRLIFSLEFVAQMVIAVHRRGFSCGLERVVIGSPPLSCWRLMQSFYAETSIPY